MWPHQAVDRLTDALADVTSDSASAHLIGAITERARHPRYRPDPRITAFIRHLSEPGTTIDAAARSVGASARTIRRHLHGDTALAPKTLQEILRLRHALAATATTGLAQAASDAGYYDQAHLTRQVRELTGTTPTALTMTAQRIKAGGGCELRSA